MIDKRGYIEFIAQKLNNSLLELEKEIHSIDDEIEKETKSSAGDKFETSREMMSQARTRIEERMAFIGQQLRTINELKSNKLLDKVEHGALVETNRGIFFFGLSIEKLNFQEQIIFNLSMASPIGQCFSNQSIGDTVSFRGTTYEIKNIS